MLIVEQNIQQVLKVVDRAYLLETGRIRQSGSAAELLASEEIRRAYLGRRLTGIFRWTSIFDIFLLEAVLNGVLLGGLLALLALGLNLIFGVIDVVWICYAELIMVGMYAIWWMHVQQGCRSALAFAFGIAAGRGAGRLRCTSSSSGRCSRAEPINQLLVTGGVLFFLQAVATVAFGVEFRNIGVRLPGVSIGEMNLSLARLIAFVVALAAIGVTWLFLTRTYLGTAIRAISQDRAIMPLMGVNPARIYLLTSAWAAGSPAWRPACWCCSTTSTRRSACRSARSRS